MKAIKWNSQDGKERPYTFYKWKDWMEEKSEWNALEE